MLELKIPGEVVAKARPRLAKRGHTYTPNKTRKYENYLKTHFRKAGVKPTDKPVEIELQVYRKLPKSWSKKKKKQALDGQVWATTKPDVDNYIKCVLDAANGHLFEDDSQVIKLTVSKQYAEEPHLLIKLKEIEP